MTTWVWTPRYIANAVGKGSSKQVIFLTYHARSYARGPNCFTLGPAPPTVSFGVSRCSNYNLPKKICSVWKTSRSRLSLILFFFYIKKKPSLLKTLIPCSKSRSAFQNKITVGPALYCIIYGVRNCCDGHRRIYIYAQGPHTSINIRCDIDHHHHQNHNHHHNHNQLKYLKF